MNIDGIILVFIFKGWITRSRGEDLVKKTIKNGVDG